MALIYCPDCGKQVSEHAEACPNCGYPVKTILEPYFNDDRTSNTTKCLVEEALEDEISIESAKKGKDNVTRKKKALVVCLSIITVFCVAFGIICVYNQTPSSNDTSEINSKKETEELFFSPSAHEGNSYYLDITSIIPEKVLLEDGGGVEPKWYICKCKTFGGGETYILISCEEYKKYFDSGAITNGIGRYKEVVLSYTVRVHGIAVLSESVISGLSRNISTFVLEVSYVD